MPPIILKGKPDRERLEALLSVMQMERAVVRLNPKERVAIKIAWDALDGFIGALEAALSDMAEAGH